jgi:indolepyruvate ferredoxin oxidoreductase, beta subunit
VASMRGLRPKSQRYADEQAVIERWLGAIDRTARIGWAPAYALALCGRLIKGYGETHARGHDNMARILDTLTGDATLARFADPDGEGMLAGALDSARKAALADPEGRALDRDIARHGAVPRPIVAKPMVFVRPRKANPT